MIKTRQELIKKYLEFFKSKSHRSIPSSSLIPENDPTVLFTTAGMHPLVPYLQGQKHPLGKKLCSVQKCIRTDDIEEIGDTTHHTFFEMLGNWSLGDYFKEEAIKLSYEFLTKVLKIPEEKIAVSCFAGDKDAPRDEESAKIWLSLGIPKERIAFLPKKDNWWGPAGKTGPCGPDTEMFFWSHPLKKAPKRFNPEDKNWVEIWNDVFMEYNKKEVKAIIVDAINCLISKDLEVNKELVEILKKTGKKIIVASNTNESVLKEIDDQLIGQDFDFYFFTLYKNPEKTNPGYFKELLVQNHYLSSEEVIYFDHKKENLESAKKAGITKVELYKNNKQIKKFIEDNLYHFEPLKQKNVDTGMGVERTLAILNGFDDNYLSPIFSPVIKEIEKISGKKYSSDEETKKDMRIISDHVRASVFILGDEKSIKPSNTEQGYILRRLIRRAIRNARSLNINQNFTAKLANVIIPQYPDYPELEKNRNFILTQLDEEENKFRKTLENGLKEFEKIVKNKKYLSGEEAFLLYQSYGFPIEITSDLAKENKIKIDIAEFKKEYEKHQELSRTASAGTFKSGLADNSEKTTKLHTATHLLNEALRKVLGEEVKQRGSNITPERLRFDFNFPRKLTPEEIKKIESLVNEKIKQSLEVTRSETSYEKAIKEGAQAEFGHKYPEIVSVYTILDKKEKKGWFSKEICTGPHVKNTKEIGKFKIIKEESSAAGVRRIKAVVED